MIDFSDNLDLAADIADRAADLGFAPALENRMGFMMDLLAADGMNGNPPIRLDVLLHKFKDSDFMHDIGGIYRHLDRKTGKLTGCFLPRCAVMRSEAV